MHPAAAHILITAFVGQSIIDQHLPWGSGAGVLEVMHQDFSIAQVSVVLLSFSSPEESPVRFASRQWLFGCNEIVNIVQRRLAGKV